MGSTRKRAALGLGLAVAAAGLAAVPATANPAGTGLVISEVYGGGGNSGATYTHDFIELHNPTDEPISVDGMSVQYRSSSGGLGGVTPLSGSVPAGGHYLVQQAQGNGGTTPLPEPDATGTLAMSGTNGIVVLAEGTGALSVPAGDAAGADGVIDLVGFGTASSYETAAAPGLSNTTAASRDADGGDTDDNSADLAKGEPAPQNSGDEGPGDPGDPDPTTADIAEIQGTGETSPLAGKAVTTRGVVTAAYPTGGFNGFYLQTAGSTPGEASNAVFVYGSSAVAAVEVGDHVEVTGEVTEYNGLTEVTAQGEDVTQLDEPGSVQPAEVPWPGSDAERERLEGMLLAPQGDFTVTDNYSLNNYAEIGLAAGTEPLRQPTDVAPYGSAEAEAQNARNKAGRVTLDDGASTNFLGADANKDIALPWLTDDPTIRVGEPVSFEKPVVLDYRFDLWRFQPTAQLTAGDENGVLPASFGDTRTRAPRDVGGDVKVGSFNVLNYFPTTGDELSGCSYYEDRDGDPVTVSGGCDVRGAAEQEDFERQQTKIVQAINAMGVDVVSLEEIENSRYFSGDRDAAMADLVDALNESSEQAGSTGNGGKARGGKERDGSGTWSYVPSPDELPASEDVIRTGFIYKRDAVKAQGESFIYDGPEFGNARQPLAQVFKPAKGRGGDKFLLIVNHFKSKGSAPSAPDPNADYGQGGWNVARTEQARALVRFADELKGRTGVRKVYLDGDFNSYSYEDPIQVLRKAGYVSLEERFVPQKSTYLFGGLVGSLDHGFANAAALETTTGADVWNINAFESVALEYSRHNYNATSFYAPTPYRSSDHDPIVFGVESSK